MQSLETFFKTAQENSLPYVVYSKPGTSEIKAFFQKDTDLHHLSDYTAEGFVFAPFDTQQPAVLFPLDQLEPFSIDMIENEVQFKTLEASTETSEKQTHIDLVQKGIDAIEKGVVEKVVLSRKQNITLKNNNPYQATLRLLLKYPAAFVYCWYHPQVGLWLGATPETLLTIENGQLETMALAGTQVFLGTLEVSWGKKEKREQELVTQAIVQNLKPLLGKQLQMEGPRTVKAGNLLHIKTTLKAALDTTIAIKDIVEALHPTPAICGYPREAAKSFILANESYDRAYYTGYLGELNMKETISRARTKRNIEHRAYQAIKRTTNLYVNLRCMQWEDNQASIYVGGGITGASLLEQEWEETVNKLQTMRTIL